MARPQKQTVDYFPHRCKHGKTMFILETKYGDKGYVFWFKLLELLGLTEGHAYCFDEAGNSEYLQAHTRTDEFLTLEILNLLANLQAIDTKLWAEKHIIWSDNFVNGVKDAYRNRVVDIPKKPFSDVRNQVSEVRNPQRRGEKIKGDKRRVNNNNNLSGNSVKEIRAKLCKEKGIKL